jgi:hypothetical protein
MVKEGGKNRFIPPPPIRVPAVHRGEEDRSFSKSSWIGRYNADMAADSMATDYSRLYNTLLMPGKIVLFCLALDLERNSE